MICRALLIMALAAGNALAHGSLHAQVAELTRSISREPGNARLYLKRGELHRQHREWQAAQADFDAVRRLDPGAVDVELAASRLAADRGLLAQSEAGLGRYLAARPNSEVAWALRADLRDRMGQYPAAAADYANAIAASAEPRAEYYLGQAQALSRAGQDEAALEAVEGGSARLGPLPVLEQWSIEHLVRMRRWDEALAGLDRTLSSTPRKEMALTRRAEILALAGRHVDALATFESARASWDALPERIRATGAMIDLQQRIDAGVDGLLGATARL
ncbi:MAG: tetratricopeptide repeat protein [Burkholderiaceae bacterium]